MASLPVALVKDWGHPRSSRSFLGYAGGGQNPSGTIVDCVANTKIPCTSDELTKFGKGHVSVTILGIVKVGFSYAPWKKPKKGATREPKDPSSKPLFDEPTFAEAQGQRVMKSIRVYSFHKVDGKNADKGPRDDDTVSVIRVGQTIHFQIHDFMFENKAYGENVFPSDVTCFPAFSVVRVMLNAGHMTTASSGYGISIGSVRSVDYSLYSYLYPLGLDLLPQSYDLAQKFVGDIADECPTIRFSSAHLFLLVLSLTHTHRSMLERTNVGFCARVNPGSFLSQGSPGWYKLVSEEGPVCDSVETLDISESDLLKFTNAGGDLQYATFLVDLAASYGALRVYVTHSEWYCKQDPTLSCFRAAPLIDTEMLLSDKALGGLLHVDNLDGAGETLTLALDDAPQLSDGTVMLQTAPSRLDGQAPTCSDLVLSSTSVQATRAYELIIGDKDEHDILRLVFRAAEGGKRAGGAFQRIDIRRPRVADGLNV